MASTNHVKSYSHLRFLFFPFTFPKFCVSTVMLLFSTYKYHANKKEMFANERYRKVNLWLKNLMSFKNIDYVLVDKKNMINSSTLIICNKDIDINNLYIFTNLFSNCPFVVHFNEPKKYHKFIKLIDINYDSSRLPIFIKNKYFVVTTIKKSEDLSSNEIFKENYLSINVVNVTEEPKKYFGKTITATFSPLIKPNDFCNFTNQALIEKINSYL